MAILKLQPACRETIWGGQRLRKDYHMQYEGANIAEAWVLSCHPSAPSIIENGIYAGKTLQQYDAELTAATEKSADAQAGLALLREYDGKIKALLQEIFGAENDFDAILDGVSLAGVGANGKRVVQNLLEALTPILRAGAEQRLQAVASAAEAELDAARAARGAE